jgi:predicted ribosomally synthesized peptide with SipW-like signal peptide
MAGRRKLRFSTRVLNRFRSTRVRVWAVLALAALVTLGVTGTYAYWSDSATVTTGSYTAGTMDLQFDTSGAVGLGTSYNPTTSWSSFVPGQNVAFALTVKDVGNAAFHYSATIKQGATWTYADNALTFQFFTSGTSGTLGQTGSSCTGTALTSAVSPTTTAQAFVPSRPLTAGGSEVLCLKVSLASTASNNDQGKSATVVFDFSAAQDVP